MQFKATRQGPEEQAHLVPASVQADRLEVTHSVRAKRASADHLNGVALVGEAADRATRQEALDFVHEFAQRGGHREWSASVPVPPGPARGIKGVMPPRSTAASCPPPSLQASSATQEAESIRYSSKVAGRPGRWGYPELLAQSSMTLKNSVVLAPACGSWTLRGECEHGHEFAKQVVCGREWCPVCGKDGSKAHQRRKAQWFPRARQLGSMGYFVFTVPPEVRDRYRTRGALGRLGKSVKRMLQGQGFSRGLRRWHPFGEPLGHGKAPQYHPHLNVLVEAGHLSSDLLDEVKASWGRILGVPRNRVNVRYRYYTTAAQMAHKVKYVTRATFLDWRWDPELAKEWVGFRNSSAWGSWEGEPVWESVGQDDGSGFAVWMLEQNRCPIDGTRVRWLYAEGKRSVLFQHMRHLGAGYYSSGDYITLRPGGGG